MSEPPPNRALLDPPEAGLASDRAEELLAECLSRPESERASALEAACSRHPDLAADLRMRVAALRAMGIELGEARGFPEQLGDFRLIERLGGGGMGVVFLAEQTSLQRDVALKLIRPEHMFFAGARARFRREAEAVARLEHPGIVPIYAVGEEAGVPYFAMELVRGCTLAEALRSLHDRAPESLRGADLHAVVARAAQSDERVPEGSLFDGTWIQACLRITRAVADALQHAHERGLVHRDVKPSNVALSPDGRVRLFDFGLTSSEGAADMTRSGSQLGTLHYMSPEQLRRAGSADARSDVYSLGVSLYEMLALQLPYRGDDALEVQRLVNDGRADPIRPRNRRVGPELETVVLHAIDRDPARRYPSAADLARDLANLLAHRPIEARRPGALVVARRWMQRHPVAATALVVAPALALGAGSAMFAQERAHSRELAAQLDEVQAARDSAESEGHRARREAVAARTALDFLAGMFTPTSGAASVAGTSVDDVLAHGERGVETQFAGDPRGQARVFTVLARLFTRRRDFQRALELHDKALALWRAEDEREVAPYLGETLTELGETLNDMGRVEEACARFREALRLLPAGAQGEEFRVRALEHLATLEHHATSSASTGSIEFARDALAAALAERVPDRIEVAEARGRLGAALLDSYRTVEAERELTLALEVLGPPGAPPSREMGQVINNLGAAIHTLGRPVDAVGLLERGLSVARAIFPAKTTPIAIVLNNLAGVEEDLGRFESSRRHLQEAVAILDETLTPWHPTTLGAKAKLANLAALRLRDFDLAEELGCQILAGGGRLKPFNREIPRALASLALSAEGRGDRSTAEGRWQEAFAVIPQGNTFGLEGAFLLHHLGLQRLAAGKLLDADVLLAAAWDILFRRDVVACPLLEDLERVARALGREQEALSYASRAEE